MLIDSSQGCKYKLGTEYVEKGKAKELSFSSSLAGHSLGKPPITKTWGHGFLADLTFEVCGAPFTRLFSRKTKTLMIPQMKSLRGKQTKVSEGLGCQRAVRSVKIPGLSFLIRIRRGFSWTQHNVSYPPSCSRHYATLSSFM